ncbi:FecR domain-containing protein [Pseudomonas sp. R5(2019)]|uniref:FecR family protein n=1 Tax=Pseudomonas sp. R5(2019) TaxID=2697566 RepID=UPI003531D904
MMDNRQHVEAVREQAALWFAKARDGEPGPEQRSALEAWLAAHPSHRHEYTVLEQLWGAVDLLPAARLRALCEPDEVVALPRRRWPGYAIAASVLACALGLGLFSALRDNSFDARYQTAAGELRQVELPDGSVIDLNSRTTLTVHYESARRSVELSQGEAMFSVHHDTSRPFVVAAGAGQVTVTGTRFDMRHDQGLTQVAVESGSVKVQGREPSTSAPVMLSAGHGSRIDDQGQVTPAYAVNTANLTAWRSGKLVFDNAPLSEVVREVSRYRDKPLRVVTGKAAELRLSSVFKTDDTEALLRALPGILPVSVRTLPDGSAEIFSR